MMTMVGQYNVIASLATLVVELCLACVLYARFRAGFILLFLASTALGLGYWGLAYGSGLTFNGPPGRAFAEAVSWWYAAASTSSIAATLWCIVFLLRRKKQNLPGRPAPTVETGKCASIRAAGVFWQIILVFLLVVGLMALTIAVVRHRRASDASDSARMGRLAFEEISTALRAYKDAHGVLPASLQIAGITNAALLNTYDYSCESQSNSPGHEQRFRLSRRVAHDPR